jgi:uncharacterized protein
MAENIVISTAPPASTASDYTKLRELGIGYIEHFARDVWTDYNTHDPGITILEMLCYAITDLSIRTQLPIEDLLTSSYKSPAAVQEAFATADLVLPTCPVTESDYRKLYIDIEGVRNAWLTKGQKTVHVNCKQAVLSHESPQTPDPDEQWTRFDLNGLYDLLIDFDHYYIQQQKEAAFLTDAQVQTHILQAVKEAYLDNRALCEDVNHIREVPVQKIMFCADVELAREANVAETHARILFQVQNYLSPFIKRYSLQEMKDTHISFDRAFEGPLLQNGFILDEELAAAGLRERVYASDLINLMMGIEINGIKVVKAVRKVKLNLLETDLTKPCEKWKTVDTAGAAWCLHIPSGHQPQLCMEKVALHFYKDIIPVGTQTTKEKALTRLLELQKAQHEANKKQIDPVPVPTGEVYDLAAYSPMINDFPQTYGIGVYGLPASATPERKAQASQLKAYLLFFDQILANYLAQLQHLKTLFSAEENAATYFAQVLSGVGDIENLYGNYTDLGSTLEAMLKTWEDFENNPSRKNRFLDHLLARFAENFSDYALLMFSLFGDRSGQDVLKDKVAFYNDFYQCPPRNAGESESDWQTRCRAFFHQVSRVRAYQYCQPAWANENVAGLTRRIARLLGMEQFRAIEPNNAEAEGGERIFLLEHILLRPDAANPDEGWFTVCTEPDCTHCRPLDPYSYRVSVVLPGYTERFRNMNFRRYAERVIREELPAHVLARICWVNREHLTLFNEKYKNWLAAKADSCVAKDLSAFATALNELLEILSQLYTVYPGGVLHDCDNPDEAAPVILGHSALGSLRNTNEDIV